MKVTFNTEKEDLLVYTNEDVVIEVMGGVKTDRLDSMRVTLKVKSGHDIARNGFDLYNDNQVQQFARRCAGKLQLGIRTILDALESLTEHLEGYILEQQAQELEQTKGYEQTKEEIKESKDFLMKKGLMKLTDENIEKSGVIGENRNRQVMNVIFTSRLMKNPLNCISMGSSGVGKSHLQESVAKLFPIEDIVEITDLTKSAFYYHGQYELCHKIILIEDLTGAKNALYPIRELQTKKRISKTVVVHLRNGKVKTERKVVEGPICVGSCTTWAIVYEDNANRSFLLDIDESVEQDQLIMEYQRQLSANLIDESEQQKIQKFMQNVQRVLRPLKVINPYATQLELPSEIFKPRRTNGHYLHFIEAVTFYHQYQRELKVDEKTGEQYIETTFEDIEIANDLLRDVLLRKADELTGSCRKFFEKLKEHLLQNELETYKVVEVRKALRIATTSMFRFHQELIELGFVKIAKGSKNKGFEYQLTDPEEYKNLENSIFGVLNTVLNNIKKSSVPKK
jgi:hypothetical protein